MLTIALLIVSNIFMTLAWYGNFKFPHLPMLAAILIGWGIALIEYSFRGSGKPDRLLAWVQRSPAQDHPGSDHAWHLCDLCRIGAERADRLALHGRFCCLGGAVGVRRLRRPIPCERSQARLFKRALQRVLVFPREVDHLGDLRLRDFVGEDAADRDTLLMDLKHHPRRVLDAHREKALKDSTTNSIGV